MSSKIQENSISNSFDCIFSRLIKNFADSLFNCFVGNCSIKNWTAWESNYKLKGSAHDIIHRFVILFDEFTDICNIRCYTLSGILWFGCVVQVVISLSKLIFFPTHLLILTVFIDITLLARDTDGKNPNWHFLIFKTTIFFGLHRRFSLLKILLRLFILLNSNLHLFKGHFKLFEFSELILSDCSHFGFRWLLHL